MTIVPKKLIILLAALLTSTSAWSATSVVLRSDDFVGITFWLISMALVAATAFFFLETQRVEGKWKTSLVVSGLVTLVAAVHYFYMREVWIQTGDTPTVFRYIDWLITVPLLMVEFYLILAAITKVPDGVFWRLMVGTVVMLVSGYLGEVGVLGHGIGFSFGMAGWIFILYEIFYGEAGKISATEAPESVKKAYNLMKLIVTIGWSVYPIGYFVGYLAGMPAEASMAGLNVVYNLADVVNKIAFGVIIWTAASAESYKTK